MAQSSQRLANGTKGIAHRSAADLSLAGSKATSAVSVSKELEKWDGDMICGQGRVLVKAFAK